MVRINPVLNHSPSALGWVLNGGDSTVHWPSRNTEEKAQPWPCILLSLPRPCPRPTGPRGRPSTQHSWAPRGIWGVCRRRGPSGCLSLGFRKPGSHCKIPATVSHTLEGGTAPHPHGPAPHCTSGCFPGQRVPFQVCSCPCPALKSCRMRVLCPLGPWSLLWPLAVSADMQCCWP